MLTGKEDALEKLAAAGLEKCLQRLSAVSHAEWRLAGAKALTAGQPEPQDPGGREAVRITVGHPAPFSTAMLFAGPDSEHLYRCFVRDDLDVKLGREGRLVTLLELGNIVLNALINSLLKALKKTAIPSVPAHLPHATNPFLPAPGSKPPLVTLRVSFSAIRDGRKADLEAVAVLPASLVAEL